MSMCSSFAHSDSENIRATHIHKYWRCTNNEHFGRVFLFGTGHIYLDIDTHIRDIQIYRIYPAFSLIYFGGELENIFFCNF